MEDNMSGFGYTMQVDYEGLAITMRAPMKKEVPFLIRGFSSLTIQMNTAGTSARTEEDELEWYEKARASNDSALWFIFPGKSENPIGVTSIHKIDTIGGCTSGIIIWEQDWWGKGIATRAHLARTLYAADFLARLKIESSVRTSNPASLRALLRVGYTVWGTESRSVYREGGWKDTYHLTWFHPEKVRIMYPKGVPDCFKEGVERAQTSLALARKVVKFP